MRKITMAALVCTTLVCTATLAAPASALPTDDDVRCFLLSNAFAKRATDPKARATAAASLTFYLGRLDGRATPTVIADSMRRIGSAIDPKVAGAQMGACTVHMAKSEQTIQAAVKMLAPPPAAAPK